MKVQNEMSTRISVEAVSAIGSMSAFRNAIRGASSAWRAQEVALKNSGNYTEAATARYRGLNKVIDLQKAKIQELRQRQEGLDIANQKQAGQYLKLENQIQSANRQLSSYSSQMERAKSSANYYASGLGKLQHQMKMSEAVSHSYIASLRAQGKVSKADRVEFNGLHESLSNLEKQQSKQRFLLKQVAEQSGKTSDAYRKQQIELNKTGETIAKTQSRMKELDKSLNPPRILSWGYFRNEILRVDEAEKKARTSAINYGQALRANIFGGWIQQGFSAITGELKNMVTNGMQAAQAGEAMENRWKNIGLAAGGVKQLSAQVSDLKTNTYLSAQSVNALQTRFYGMTHSVRQTKVLTQSVGSLTDKLKLSEQQSNAFAGGLSRIESSGKVTGSTLGRLEKQAPGLTAAMARASGMSQAAFKQLVASGKMTAGQFNQLMIKASGDYKQNAKSFSQTSGGAMHKLRAEWTTTQAKLAKPLLKVSSTGLNELSKALNNKDTQRGLQMLAKGMADAAVNAAKFIGFVAKHQTTVKVFGVTVLGLAAAFKTMQGTVMAVDIVSRFAKLSGTAKVIGLVTKNVKLLGTAVKVATLGFNPWVIAIGAVVAGFTLLYKHSKKFRKFVNGLVSAAKSGMKKVGKWFSTTFKKINSDHRKSNRAQQKANQQNQRAWNNYWKQHNRVAEQNQRKQERAEQASQRRRSRAIANFNKDVVRGSNNMWKSLQRNASNGVRNAERAWKNIESSAQRGSKNIGRWYQQMSRETGRTIDNMRKEHPRTFNAMYKAIQDRSKLWHDVTTGHWNRLGSDTATLANDMNKFHQRLFKDMYDKLNDMTGGRLGDMLKTWQNIFSSTEDAVGNAVGAVHRKFVDIVTGVLRPFKTTIDDIKGGINWVLDKLGASKLSGDFSISMPSYATGTQGAHPGGFAKVNDGKTGHYRELYRLPNGEVGMFPAVRNMLVPLPKGTSILDGERSYSLMRMMGRIPHYADGVGALSDMFSNVVNSTGDALDGMMDEMDKIVSHPIEFMESVFKKFVRVSTPVKFASDLVTYVPKFIAKQMGAWIKKQFEELANPGGSGVERWRPYVIRALKMNGFEASAYQVAAWMKVIQRESNGNPHAINNWDSNARAGHPSKGLVQTIDSTFNANAFPGHHNIWNGFDDLLAGIHYMAQKYGRGSGAFARVSGPMGYADGGLINKHGLYEVGEYNRPEMIVPLDMSKRSRAYQLLGEIIARFHAEEPNHSNQTVSSDDHKQLQELNTKFDQLLTMFNRLLGLNDDQLQATKDQGTLDPHKLYKKMARDQAMRQFSS